MTLTVLSPYPIPAALAGRKVANLGDGFILRAIERLMGARAGSAAVVSPRVEPTPAEQSRLAEAPVVLIGGANQLNDRYRIWPGMTAERLRGSSLRFAPFAVGVHGEAGKTDAMSAPTRDILELMHERIEFSSWRCPATVRYLKAALPALADRFLLTGCPVAFDRPLLEGRKFHEGERTVAVTATERGDFFDRDRQALEYAARRFPRARKLFVVHQDFRPQRPLEGLRQAILGPGRDAADPVVGLRRLARRLGFRVVAPRTPDEGIRLYEGVDLHLGSRLHAHLLMLSRNRRSVLVPVDGRAAGMAELFDFPLADPARLDDALNADFEAVRAAAHRVWPQMRRFIRSVGGPQLEQGL